MTKWDMVFIIFMAIYINFVGVTRSVCDVRAELSGQKSMTWAACTGHAAHVERTHLFSMGWTWWIDFCKNKSDFHLGWFQFLEHEHETNKTQRTCWFWFSKNGFCVENPSCVMIWWSFQVKFRRVAFHEAHVSKSSMPWIGEPVIFNQNAQRFASYNLDPIAQMYSQMFCSLKPPIAKRSDWPAKARMAWPASHCPCMAYSYTYSIHGTNLKHDRVSQLCQTTHQTNIKLEHDMLQWTIRARLQQKVKHISQTLKHNNHKHTILIKPHTCHAMSHKKPTMTLL